MNYINFSKSYHVRMLIERDIPLILRLCEKNEQFYEHCPPFVTAESIRDDMCALPQRKMDEPQDKYDLGFFDDAEQLVAVLDFIDHYPTEQSCFIGFFMMERSVQGHGIGSRIITELCVYLHSLGYEYIRLGYVDGNKQSESFWKKNQFTDTGLRNHTQDYTVVVMNRMLLLICLIYYRKNVCKKRKIHSYCKTGRRSSNRAEAALKTPKTGKEGFFTPLYFA